MKKIGRRALVLFAVAFISTLIVTAPASVLSSVVESASKGQFALANTSGTVWQGSATPAIRQRSGNFFALERLHWDIAIWPLFSGKMVCQLHWESVEQAQPMIVTASFSQIELRNVLVPLHAGVLGELAPMLQPAQLSGQMQLRSEQFTLSRQGINGSAVADWMNAGSVLSAVNPLGSYRLQLAGAGERLNATLSTVSGVLLLEGSGSFARDQGLKFQVTARASEESKGSIKELLNNFGPESAPGVHTLNLMR